MKTNNIKPSKISVINTMVSKKNRIKLSDYISMDQIRIPNCHDCGEHLDEVNCKLNERKTKYKHEDLCDICYHQYLYYDYKN